jgi:hypothetical protein
LRLSAVAREDHLTDIDVIAPGRSCAGCTLCCKIMGIAALEKPPGVWCKHCEPASGCRIYEDRPQECRTFFCGYLINGQLGEEWKPSRSRLVLELQGNRIGVHVDPQRPDAWRREPFYSSLKRWAASAVQHRGEVVAYIGKRVHVIFPDRDVDLGIVGDDEIIVTGESVAAGTSRPEAIKINKNDPRAQKILQQHAEQQSKLQRASDAAP